MDLASLNIPELAAPVGTGAVLWFFIKAWIAQVKEDQKLAMNKIELVMASIEELEEENAVKMDRLSESIASIRLELADAGIKRTFEEVEKLKEKATRMEGQIHAAWKALDRLGGKEPRLSDDIEQ